MAGHGGEDFMKFQDQQELTAAELGDAFAAMRAAGRYREVLMISETCQAESLHSQLRSPGLLSIASSKVGALPLRLGPSWSPRTWERCNELEICTRDGVSGIQPPRVSQSAAESQPRRKVPVARRQLFRSPRLHVFKTLALGPGS